MAKEDKLITNKITSEARHPFRFSITQWNGHSINTQEKLNYINLFNSNVIVLQEIWQRGQTVSDHFKNVELKERATQRNEEEEQRLL